MAIAVGDHLELRFFCTLADQTAINVIHQRVTSVVVAGAPLTDQDIAENLSTAFSVLYKAGIANSALYYGMQLLKYIAPDYVVQWETGVSAGAGTGGAVPLAKQTCGVVAYRANAAGPASRGRTYFPFPTEDANILNGSPNGGYTALLQQFGDSVVGPINVPNPPVGSSVTMVGEIYHRPDTAHPAAAWQDMVQATARPIWGTQRRRGSFGRPNAPPF